MVAVAKPAIRCPAKERQRAYHQRPDVKERQRAYMREYYQTILKPKRTAERRVVSIETAKFHARTLG